MFDYILWLLFGTAYGFIIGLIPVAGASTALITIYGFLDVFRADPYTLVVFTTAIVVASTIGDSFASIVLNIPGASGSAATIVDGFPMAKKGEAARALSAAITTSTLNGFIFGIIALVFLPFYSKAVLAFGIPELLCFLILAFTCVTFITSDKWVRGLFGLSLGIFLGMVGQHPTTNAARWTFDWDYIKAGIQIMPVLAGVLAFPELIEAYRSGYNATTTKIVDAKNQTIQGIKDTFIHWKDSLRGGAIGAFIGVLPGVGGAVADWIAYSQAVALNKNEKIPFGEGNIKGVIGCEGANNSQKATGYIPTVLFGIPAAPFEAIILSLFVLVGIELGTPNLLKDMTFFKALNYSYMASLVLTFIVSMFMIKYITLIFEVPFSIWFYVLSALLIWSCVQYTGYWEDYFILSIFIILGLLLKYFSISRAAFIIGFVLSDQIEKMYYQYTTLFEWHDAFTRPISLTLIIVTVALAIYGIFFNKTRISYT